MSRSICCFVIVNTSVILSVFERLLERLMSTKCWKMMFYTVNFTLWTQIRLLVREVFIWCLGFHYKYHVLFAYMNLTGVWDCWGLLSIARLKSILRHLLLVSNMRNWMFMRDFLRCVGYKFYMTLHSWGNLIMITFFNFFGRARLICPFHFDYLFIGSQIVGWWVSPSVNSKSINKKAENNCNILEWRYRKRH